MIVHERRANVRRDDQRRQQRHANNDVGSRGNLAQVDGPFLVPSDPPAVQIHCKNQIIDDSVGNSSLDTGHHGILCLARGVLLPGPAVLLDHAHELDVAGHDGRDGGDQARAEEEVGDAGHV